jgi:histone H3/H4
MDVDDPRVQGVFKHDCWAKLISELPDNERLSKEAMRTLNFIGPKLLIALTQESCAAAQRRESNTVTPEDVRFAADSIRGSASPPAPAPPLEGHKERLEMLKDFREAQERPLSV